MEIPDSRLQHPCIFANHRQTLVVDPTLSFATNKSDFRHLGHKLTGETLRPERLVYLWPTVSALPLSSRFSFWKSAVHQSY